MRRARCLFWLGINCEHWVVLQCGALAWLNLCAAFSWVAACWSLLVKRMGHSLGNCVVFLRCKNKQSWEALPYLKQADLNFQQFQQRGRLWAGIKACWGLASLSFHRLTRLTGHLWHISSGLWGHSLPPSWAAQPGCGFALCSCGQSPCYASQQFSIFWEVTAWISSQIAFVGVCWQHVRCPLACPYRDCFWE